MAGFFLPLLGTNSKIFLSLCKINGPQNLIKC